MTEILEGGRKRDPKTGLIFPWYTWPCLEWLDSLDLSGKRVFEYGIGDSTLWYRAKGAISDGVDSDFSWASKFGVSYAVNSDYIQSAAIPKPGNFNLFDIVVIDGMYRDQCTKYALRALKSGGYLIIDNYHQPSVEPNDWHLTDKLIEGMPITIYKQPNHDDWSTAVITKP